MWRSQSKHDVGPSGRQIPRGGHVGWGRGGGRFAATVLPSFCLHFVPHESHDSTQIGMAWFINEI
jgi:hypothetical protein